MITCTKKYTDFPFAHRQPNHPGHCRLIHGHNWAFEFEFACKQIDACGFVIDFGSLGWLKEWLDQNFDHTLVLNDRDPALRYLRDGLVSPEGCDEELKKFFPFAKIVNVPDCSSEGLADFLFGFVNNALQARTEGRVFLRRVTVYEDSKNSASLTNINITTVKKEEPPRE